MTFKELFNKLFGLDFFPYSHMNSKGIWYYLHSKEVILNGGRQQIIYFFCKDIRKEYAIRFRPEDMSIVENQRTGLPMLKKGHYAL